MGRIQGDETRTRMRSRAAGLDTTLNRPDPKGRFAPRVYETLGLDLPPPGNLPYTDNVMPSTPAPAPDSAHERLEARITARQKALFREAADLQGVTLTDFIVSSVHQAAVRALEARHVLDLSRQDQAVFVQALLEPPAANARLRTAWSRHARIDRRARTAPARKRRATRA